MSAYYNEHDPKAAAWLRELIRQGHIANGEVDERSIEDVTPIELAGFTQCHFFAGIGVWSYALRRAGIGDDQPVWTGSCPCQPFSAAGQGAGFADERHLWPAFFHLIEQCRPGLVFGEQVASKDGLAWLDLVQSDLEGAGYASRAVDNCAAGFGAPHIRQRLYWVADTESERRDRGTDPAGKGRGDRAQDSGYTGIVGHTLSAGLERHSGDGDGTGGWAISARPAAEAKPTGPLANTTEPRYHQTREHKRGSPCLSPRPAEHGGVVRPANPTHGQWADADWLRCRDDLWRPVEARVQQMAHGYPLHVGRVLPAFQQEVERILNEASYRLQTETRAIMSAVREAVGTEDIFGARGGLLQFHEAQVLLSYLLEYTGEAGNKPNSDHGASQGGRAQRDLRMLWRQRADRDPSYQRELARQPLRELADAMCVLSSTMARSASETGYPMLYTDAPASFPLGQNLYQDQLGQLRPKARTPRLRAYGNALCAPQAIAFIEAYCEIMT